MKEYVETSEEENKAKPFKVVTADAPICGCNEKDQNKVSLEL